MKIYLFLYPISEYVDFEVKNYLYALEENDTSYMRINDIINKRYRENGYQINWLLFSDKNGNPDLSILSKVLDVKRGDNILTAGISFKKHIKEKTYPDSTFILNQLPNNIEKLVLGGFHQNDCVDRIAKFAFKKGIDVLVDEDTTDFFFKRNHLKMIPLIRNELSLKALGISDDFIERVKEVRKDKPWFVQN